MVIDATPQFAVIGHPIAHSRSPAIHAAFAAELGLKLVYGRIDCPVDDFEAQVTQFFAAGGAGLNVTVPFKERAWRLASANLSARARNAGAANTLWMAQGQLHGCNTDGVGLVNDLKRLAMPLAGAHILLIGAGGAARGVLGPLLDAGCAHIHIVNRGAARAHELVNHWVDCYPGQAQRLSASGFAELDQANNTDQKRFELMINATASSLQGESLPVPSRLFGSDIAVYDMMYGKGLTAFLQQARQAGSVKLADGLGMLVGQAAESFRIWLGQMPNPEPVIAKIRAQLETPVR